MSTSKATKDLAEKKSGKKAKKDVEEPKTEKKRTAYQKFCDKHRKELKESGLSFAEVSKKLGEMWASDPSNHNAGKPKRAKKTDEEKPQDEDKNLEANKAKIAAHLNSVAEELKVED